MPTAPRLDAPPAMLAFARTKLDEVAAPACAPVFAPPAGAPASGLLRAVSRFAPVVLPAVVDGAF